MDSLDSYTEYSPSGKGLHTIAKAKLQSGGRKTATVEVYDQGRYFTMTGRVFENHETIEDRGPEVVDLYESLRDVKSAASRASDYPTVIPFLGYPFDLAFKRRIGWPMKANPKFCATWEHQRADLADQSLSSYDAALCGLAVRGNWSDAELARLICAHRVRYGGPA